MLETHNCYCKMHGKAHIKTEKYFICSNFFSENRVVSEIMSKNVVGQRPQTVWRICVACWVSKAGHARIRVPTPTPAFKRMLSHACALTERYI